MKKFLAVILMGALLLSSVGCTKEEEAEVQFQEQSYTYVNEHGCTMKLTVSISPWILQSKTKVVNEAWEAICVDPLMKLPTIDDLGLEVVEHDGVSYYVKEGEDFVCRSEGFDMYFAMGTITIEEITSGQSFMSDYGRSIEFNYDSSAFICYKDDGYYEETSYGDTLTNKTILNYDVLGLCRTYVRGEPVDAYAYDYRVTSPIRLYFGYYRDGKAGPMNFILMRGESFTAEHPEGIYYESIKDSETYFSGKEMYYSVADKTSYELGYRMDGIPEDEILTFKMDVIK